jgi:hypothetical protein
MIAMNAVGIVRGNFGALQAAQSGIARASQNIDRDAAAIADGALSGNGPGDIAAAMVDMSQQSEVAAVSAQAMSIANQTIGSLLDVMA